MKDAMEPAHTGAPPESYQFLNPGFKPSFDDPAYVRIRPTSELAHQVGALIDTARFASENDTSGVPLDRRGISGALEVASYMISDLIGRCENLERRLEDISKQEAV